MKTYAPEEFPVRCEIYSRIVGYLRPLDLWNDGKQEEFRERLFINIEKQMLTIKR